MSLKGLIVHGPTVDRATIIGHPSWWTHMIVMRVETSVSFTPIKLICAVERHQFLTQFLWFECCSLIIFVAMS